MTNFSVFFQYLLKEREIMVATVIKIIFAGIKLDALWHKIKLHIGKCIETFRNK